MTKTRKNKEQKISPIIVKCEELITPKDYAKNWKMINHPQHYCHGNIETIDLIEDWNLNYHIGNCIKYISRAGKKQGASELTDMCKARWYLDRYIEFLKKKNNEKNKV